MFDINPAIPQIMHHSGWPWPLDAVQDWFDELWDSLNSWIYDASKTVWTWVPEPLKNFIAFLEDLTRKTWDSILAFFKDPLGTLKDAFDTVINRVQGFIGWWDSYSMRFVGGFLGWLWDTLNLIGNMVADAAGWAWEQMDDAASQIWSTLTEVTKWLSDQVSAGLGWLKDVIWDWVDGTLSWLTDSFKWLQGELVSTGEWITSSVSDVVEEAVHHFSATVEEVLAGVAESLSEGFKTLVEWFWTQLPAALTMVWEFLDEKVLSPLWKGLQWLWDWITERATGAFHAVEALFESHSMITPEAASELAPKVLLAAAGLGLAATGITSVAGIKVVGTGLEVGEIGSYVKDLLSPGMFVGATVGTLIGVGLTTPLKYHYNKLFTPLIPPIPDLIRFVVREVIKPEEFYELAQYHGFSEERAKWYWNAHWVLPAWRNVVDSYHRGALTSKELDKFAEWHDYSPDPRPGIGKSDIEIMRSTLKTLIPRVDLRYAWELGRLTDEQLVESYYKLGYEDDAPLMAEIQMARALVEEIHKVRDEWLRYFIEGFIDETTLRANLAEIGIGPARIEYYVEYASRRRTRELMADLLDLYDDGYQKDLISEEDLRLRVGEIIVIPEVADLFVDKAYTRKYRKPSPPKETEEEAAEKAANKYRISHARELYRQYAIDKAQFTTLLVEYGVHPTVAAARADYEELKLPLPKPSEAEVKAAKEKAQLQSVQVKTAVEEYRNYAIDEDELLKRLLDAGISEALATANMQLERIRRPAPTISPEEEERRHLEETVKRYRILALVENYRNYALEKAELIASLIEAGVDPAEAAARADYEEARRPVPKPAEEDVTAAREETRARKVAESEALALFRAEEISSEGLTSRLRELGLGEDLISALVSYEEVKLALKKAA